MSLFISCLIPIVFSLLWVQPAPLLLHNILFFTFWTVLPNAPSPSHPGICPTPFHSQDLSYSPDHSISTPLVSVSGVVLGFLICLGFSFSHRIQGTHSFTAGMLTLFWSLVKRCSRSQQIWELLEIPRHQWAVTPSPMGPSVNLHSRVFQYQIPASRHQHWVHTSTDQLKYSPNPHIHRPCREQTVDVHPHSQALGRTPVLEKYLLHSPYGAQYHFLWERQ